MPFSFHFDIVSCEMEKGRFMNMAYTITDECTCCGTCSDECAVDAISEGDGKYVIDRETCADCGACVDACPIGAIIEE